MTFGKSLPTALPAIYFALFLITLISGENTTSSGNPFVCVSLPWSLPLVATDSTTVVVIVGVLATAWWCFIGYVGRSAGTVKLTRTVAVLGAGPICLVSLGEGALMISEFRLISRESNFALIDWTIYTLAAALLLGGLSTAGHTILAAAKSR